MTRSHNIYVYAKRTLWLAYGLAIAFTILAVAAGIVALVMNGASFRNSFSTIVRVSRVAMLSEEVTESDGDGTEPLPKHLAESRLLMRRQQEKRVSGSTVSSKSTQETSLLTPGS